MAKPKSGHLVLVEVSVDNNKGFYPAFFHEDVFYILTKSKFKFKNDKIVFKKKNTIELDYSKNVNWKYAELLKDSEDKEGECEVKEIKEESIKKETLYVIFMNSGFGIYDKEDILNYPEYDLSFDIEYKETEDSLDILNMVNLNQRFSLLSKFKDYQLLILNKENNFDKLEVIKTIDLKNIKEFYLKDVYKDNHNPITSEEVFICMKENGDVVYVANTDNNLIAYSPRKNEFLVVELHLPAIEKFYSEAIGHTIKFLNERVKHQN